MKKKARERTARAEREERTAREREEGREESASLVRSLMKIMISLKSPSSFSLGQGQK